MPLGTVIALGRKAKSTIFTLFAVAREVADRAPRVAVLAWVATASFTPRSATTTRSATAAHERLRIPFVSSQANGRVNSLAGPRERYPTVTVPCMNGWIKQMNV